MSNEILNNNEEETVLEKVNEYVASDHLRVLCANVDTLTNKMDELSIRVISENPDVICLQEVLPKNTYEEIEVGIELQINGYEMFKPSVMKRGVITYIKKEIQTMQLEPTEQFDESVWCMMLIKDSERILVGNVYRSPSSDTQNYINNIDWENELRGKNTEESWEILENVVKESIERNIPMQKVGKTFKKKWMTKETMNVVKEKHKAYKKYRKLKTNESKDDYNRAKQKAIYATKKARTDFETRIATI